MAESPTPSAETPAERLGESTEPLLEVEGLAKYFQSDTGFLSGFFGSPDVKAVDDVSFTIGEGETFALVGESGCGKSTLARTVLRLEDPTSGAVRFRGQDLAALSNSEMRSLRKDVQLISQDPQSSLDPRMTIGESIEEPMKAHGVRTKETRPERTRELLSMVGLDPSYYNRYPHEFSGGQRQRINLARALATDPELIVCDEPVSALDVSIQAQVLNTMLELQDAFDISYLFISHNLSVVRYIADTVAVMYLGKIVEQAEKEELFENPQHPYTQTLLASVPSPDPRSRGVRVNHEGDVPSPIDPPSGCRFRTRCRELLQPGVGDVAPQELSEAVRDARLESYDIRSDRWDALLSFIRAVKRREFTYESREGVLEEYFPMGLPAGEPGEVIDDAIERVAEGSWETAGDLLLRTFQDNSICAVRQPDYVVDTVLGEGEHYSACHLHRGDADAANRE
ncbi:oligopeptide/dipeptide ABC transporter ATP-binding protein [Halobellus sp. GM3]|uniref:oligopeptide/dipeptide ABC transporter ATP-binding protein n=1 Tax=Halobellus sp. GM3 TaxID=3458410 RepID=UPI00403E269F